MYILACCFFSMVIILWGWCIKCSKSFSVKLLYIFWGVYYVFPPVAYFIFVPYPGYVGMSGESIFLAENLVGYPFLLLNIMAFCFLLASLPLLQISTKSCSLLAIRREVYINKGMIFSISMVILIAVFLMNLYLVLKVGGLYEFYFGSDWHSRYQGAGALLVIIMNLKSILPCVGAALAALLLYFRSYRYWSFFFLFSFILLLVFGGSNRKFALLAIFIYFIVCVDVLGIERGRRAFYCMIGFMFLLFQALLFLRSSSFDIEALINAFSVMGDVILSSEPVGTYSINLGLLDKMVLEQIPFGNFYDVLKFLLIPFKSFVEYSRPNVAWVLGGYVNDVPGFTFFPTLLIEGFYNGGVLGFVVMIVVYTSLCFCVVKSLNKSSSVFSVIFYVCVYSVCLLQLIRGYSSVCLAYFVIIVLSFFCARVFFSGVNCVRRI